MILNNFMKLSKHCFTSANLTIRDLSMINTTGTGMYSYGDMATVLGQLAESGFIRLGYGEGSVSSSDYEVNTPASFTYVSNSSTVNPTGNVFLLVKSTVRNDSTMPITVTNLGIAGYDADVSYNPRKPILYSKEVLEEPVTVQPGETHTFTGIIKSNF